MRESQFHALSRSAVKARGVWAGARLVGVVVQLVLRLFRLVPAHTCHCEQSEAISGGPNELASSLRSSQ